MKHWVVSYSILYKDGSITERNERYRAATIEEALEKAMKNIVAPAKRQQIVKEVAIWNIEITDDDVF